LGILEGQQTNPFCCFFIKFPANGNLLKPNQLHRLLRLFAKYHTHLIPLQQVLQSFNLFILIGLAEVIIAGRSEGDEK